KYIKKKAVLVDQVDKKMMGKRITMVGIVTSYRKITTKSGTYMASFILEDPVGRVDCIIFPKQFQKYGHVFEEDALVVMGGRIDNKRGDIQFACDEAKVVSLDKMISNAKSDGLFDPEEKAARIVKKLSMEQFGGSDKEAVVPEEVIEDVVVEDYEEASGSPFVIEVDQSKVGVLPRIKEILMANSGGDKMVEIRIGGEGGKKVKVPFMVKLSPEVMKEIEQLSAHS
ncbi:MAG: OB-fold nucleic acid binding domain-containing protein, partial [Candidatus Gracilibacteria bacterium]